MTTDERRWLRRARARLRTAGVVALGCYAGPCCVAAVPAPCPVHGAAALALSLHAAHVLGLAGPMAALERQFGPGEPIRIKAIGMSWWWCGEPTAHPTTAGARSRG